MEKRRGLERLHILRHFPKYLSNRALSKNEASPNTTLFQPNYSSFPPCLLLYHASKLGFFYKKKSETAECMYNHITSVLMR